MGNPIRRADTSDTTKRSITWVRRIFALAWLLIALYGTLFGVAVLFGYATGSTPEAGPLFAGPDYPAFMPPIIILALAATILLIQSIWTIPLHLDGSIATHRLLHAIITIPVVFIAVLSYAWLAGQFGDDTADIILTTISAILVAASALFGLRWFLEFIHLIPKKWRTPNAY